MDIQKTLVEEFRKKLEKGFTELTGTQFECIDNNGELFITGTLITVDGWEVFRILETSDQKPWITYIGEAYSHEQFVKPNIVHNGM